MHANSFTSLIFKTLRFFNDIDDINITMNDAAATSITTTTNTTNTMIAVK